MHTCSPVSEVLGVVFTHKRAGLTPFTSLLPTGQYLTQVNDDDDFISITNMIYLVKKKDVKNDAHDTKNDKSLTNMA